MARQRLVISLATLSVCMAMPAVAAVPSLHRPLCIPSTATTDWVAQQPIEEVRFPHSGIHEIRMSPVIYSSAQQILGGPVARLERAQLTLIDVGKKGTLIGLNAGEWGGMLLMIDKKGKRHEIARGNVTGGLRVGKKLFVLTGLSHLTLSIGELWEVNEKGNLPTIVSRIPFPTEVEKIWVSKDALHFQGRKPLMLQPKKADILITSINRSGEVLRAPPLLCEVTTNAN